MPDDALNPPEALNPSAAARDVPLSRAELDGWYTERLLSLEEIAALAAERLGVPVTRTKVREWLLILGIPRRSFSEAARARFLKRRAATADTRSGGQCQARQLALFPEEDR